MNFIIIILLIVVIAYLINDSISKKKAEKLKQDLIDNWGMPKIDEYYDFHSINRYFKNNKHKSKAFQIISDKTKIDLDLEDIFKFIDRTSSKIGQQYLYYKLMTICDVIKLKKFKELTDTLDNDSALRLDCQIALSELNSSKSYDLEALVNNKEIEKPKYFQLLQITAILNLAFFIGGFFNPILFILILPLYSFNLVMHYKNKGIINYYLNGVVQLLKALKTSKSLAKHKKIQQYFSDFSFIKKIEKIKFKTQFISFEKNIDNDFTSIFWFIFELIKIPFNIEILVFYSFIDHITKEKNSIEKMLVFIGEIDSAISTASIKHDKLTTCTPKFTSEKLISFKDIRHPLIEDCIPNDLQLKNNSMLLTGSNMSGKTTFIRTVAINSLLAQTLNICFAEEFIAPFQKIYTSIRITDNLAQKTSYYLEEVLTAKELIIASKDKTPVLFILDEIFKGTNTIERISSGKAILSYLNKGNNTVFVSTHDIELTELLKNDNYLLYHFSEQIEDDKLIFDHKLKEGKLKTYNAIKILELYDYPAEIINDALNTKKQL